MQVHTQLYRTAVLHTLAIISHFSGVARRKCLDGGRWDRVDISECVNKEISDLRIKVTETFYQLVIISNTVEPSIMDTLKSGQPP